MLFQLWRHIGKRVNVFEPIGYVTAETRVSKAKRATKQSLDEAWACERLLATNRLPVVPGDLLLSQGTGLRYKVLGVRLNVEHLVGDDTRYAWEIEARTLQIHEQFVKYRDFQQCSRKKPKS